MDSWRSAPPKAIVRGAQRLETYGSILSCASPLLKLTLQYICSYTSICEWSVSSDGWLCLDRSSSLLVSWSYHGYHWTLGSPLHCLGVEGPVYRCAQLCLGPSALSVWYINQTKANCRTCSGNLTRKAHAICLYVLFYEHRASFWLLNFILKKKNLWSWKTWL